MTVVRSYLACGLEVIRLQRRRPRVFGDAEARPLEERVHVLHRLPDDLARCRALQVRRKLQKPAEDHFIEGCGKGYRSDEIY